MAKPNVWMSVSDLMTGLMVIFLFITVSYMSQMRKNQRVLDDYVETKNQLHDTLSSRFQGDTTIMIGKDLSMKFTQATTLFETAKADIRPEFQQILDNILPRYFDILLNSDFRDKIVEVRVEGHTDDVPFPQKNEDPYIANIMLSQERALEIVKYIRSMSYYNNLTKEDQDQLQFWLTANGLSFGKAIDKNGEYTFISKYKIDRAKSRRVEFRIVTSGEELLVDFVNKNENSLTK